MRSSPKSSLAVSVAAMAVVVVACSGKPEGAPPAGDAGAAFDATRATGADATAGGAVAPARDAAPSGDASESSPDGIDAGDTADGDDGPDAGDAAADDVDVGDASGDDAAALDDAAAPDASAPDEDAADATSTDAGAPTSDGGHGDDPDAARADASLTCEAPRPDRCAGGCTDLATDRDNCGTCGNACPTSGTCRNRECACTGAASTFCAATYACADLTSDRANCGACGAACGPTQICQGARCVPCAGRVCGNACKALDDRASCGACGRTCAENEACQGGSCVRCAGTRCGNACVDLTSDRGNCGGCGITCAPSQDCARSLCVDRGALAAVGPYERLPIENNWHPGRIEQDGAILRWRNEAGASWRLVPDPARRRLLTDTDCPYRFAPGGDAFTLLFDGDTVVGFSFQNEIYSRRDMPFVVYGRSYHLRSEYSGGQGGYLDTRNPGCEGNLLCVSTSHWPDRDTRSGTWRVLSATGKRLGTVVTGGDVIRLVNEYPYRPVGGAPVPGMSHYGGFLDTCVSGCEGNVLCVSTAASHDRANARTADWRVEDAPPLLRAHRGFSLRNGWAGFQGGVLGVWGAGCESNLYCVSTLAGGSNGNATWSAIPR